MDKSDIRDVRRWHREAALRAKQTGFDIVYVYATHGYLLSHFLSAATNTRTDEYGGSLENRVRLVRELIEETKEAVGDKCAVAVRFSAEQGGGEDGQPVTGEHQDMLGMLAELPDLWDVNISDYSLEMGTSRFVKEGALEAYTSYVKTVTSKPVVSVGRFTSPDTMVSQIKRGVLDFIGAARPSIADPFLPNKIEQGRPEDIRECIGCNICYTGDGLSIPIHCTQNPTISEGWRRGWHPENIAPKASDSSVLVIGAGPAGLEATRALGQRGYRVMLAEATCELGGRVTREATLPGLSEWIRVRDYRVNQIQSMSNVEVYLESDMNCESALQVEADYIAVATGARWRKDGFGRFNSAPAQFTSAEKIFTPDDILAGRLPSGHTLIFDDDNYYHASTIAEKLRLADVPVTFVTPATEVSAWSNYTADQTRLQRRLIELGVNIVIAHGVSSFDGSSATINCVYTNEPREIKTESLVTVTSRQPVDSLYHELKQHVSVGSLKTVKRIGDCDAPSIIATAVFAGHRYARELDQGDEEKQMRFDRVFFED